MIKFNLLRAYRCCPSTDIELYEGDRAPQNLKIFDNGEEFEEGHDSAEHIIDIEISELDSSITDEIRNRIKLIDQQYPAYDDLFGIYKMLFDKLVTKKTYYISKYSTLVDNIYDTSGNEYLNLTVGNPKEDGTYENSQRFSSIIYQWSGKEINKPYEGMPIFVTRINNGYGCMTTNFVLGIFSDEEEWNNFGRKVNDAVKHYVSDPESTIGWEQCCQEKYILRSDLKTFKHC